jgi:putative flavoprotein involved in K+ transport
LRRLAADGVVLLGRILGGRDGRLTIAKDLDENLLRADRSFADFIREADEHVARGRFDLPSSDVSSEAFPDLQELIDPIQTLDLANAGISTVIWANGFRYDFDWIDLPIFEEASSGRIPTHKRGVTAVPGVYFLGLPWLRKLKSAFLHGVGEDAEYLAERIAGGECPARVSCLTWPARS